ncbi:hypothetical protein TcasGA2_TC005429 [Tribolium castaneum]|uniref:Uncharacterized protein n=1 Tax=Tribolium castaneum TaxID=7070 RepID=D6WYV2_TRICA|nr:hypothetical protein TcasGA2_TC005429 [Tribolium castaneum]
MKSSLVTGSRAGMQHEPVHRWSIQDRTGYLADLIWFRRRVTSRVRGAASPSGCRSQPRPELPMPPRSRRSLVRVCASVRPSKGVLLRSNPGDSLRFMTFADRWQKRQPDAIYFIRIIYMAADSYTSFYRYGVTEEGHSLGIVYDHALST